jgi:hypothetical protein
VLGGIQSGPLESYLREVFAGRGDDGLLQRFQMAVWPDVGGLWQNVDRWPNAEESRVARFRLPQHHAFDG